MREDVRPYIRRNTKTPPKLPSELFLSLYVIVPPTKYEDTAETPLRVLVFMLSCHCVIDEIRKHRRNSPPSSCLYVVMSLCHGRHTKGPTADFPDRPFHSAVLCHRQRKDRPPIFRTDLFFLLSYVIDNERTDRRFSRPTFFSAVLCHRQRKDRLPIFRTDRFLFLLCYIIDNERTDRRFSGPTFYFCCLAV